MVGEARAYGSRIVAGVTPGKGGQRVHGVPVYDSVQAAVTEHEPTLSIVSVPGPAVLDAAYEAIVCGIKLCLILTEAGSPKRYQLYHCHRAPSRMPDYRSQLPGIDTAGDCQAGYDWRARRQCP